IWMAPISSDQPPSGAGGTSIGGYGIHVVGAHSEIINAGRIVPGVGAAQAVAIMYGPDAHDSILRLQGGSDIVGAVDATRSRGNRLILDGPGPMDAQTQLRRAFDVSKLGALGTNVATTDLYQGFTAFEKASPGTWELRGAPTQAHTPWTVTGGMLAIHGDEQLGSQDDAVKLQGGALQILDDTDLKHDMQVDGIGGILVENADARVQLRGRISGSGMLVKMGGGLLTVLSDNDFRGTTRVGTTRLDGRMRIGDGGSTGSLGAGPIEINAVLVIDRKDALTMHNPIRGEGDLIQRGDGTTTLRGPLAFAGHTYVDRGTLRIEDTTLGSRATGLAAVLALNPHPGSPPQQLLDLRHAVLNGWIDGVAQARIDRTSVWNLYIDDRYPREQMPDHSWVGALDLAGRLDFQDPRPQGQSIGRSVAIDGLTGRGGAVTLYVKPTADGVADHLVLAHGATGTTRVALKMQGAEGADPLAGDGLLIVQSGGKTDHAFVQDGESASGNRSGAFIYYLRHGGRPIGGVPRNPNNWYLGNEVRPEVSIYTQLGTQAARYGEISAGTLNARMGASEALANKVYPYAWGRLLSDVSRNDGGPMGLVDQRIATRTQLFGLQLGTDVHVVTRGLTRRSVGLYVSAATSNANVSHYSERVGASIPAGRSRLNAYGMGGYYTYFDGKGGYLDVVTQFSSFDARTRATQESLRLRSRGWGLLLSAEAGKSFAVGAEDANLRLEPQAQAIYQHISLGDSRDPASEVGLPTLDTLTARLGVRGSRTWNPARKNTGTAWLALDLLASVGRSASTYPSATQGRLAFLNRQPGPRVGLKLGYDRLVGRNAFVSVQGGTEQSLGGARSRNYTGNIGLKVLF
ncbi:MAG: autotransporter outer membrane beta-barrel domain-containing protein, partial [Bordetella sp.]|nr:autotransporter outer membrane beta-barrel domain-containing protein [Bordetella sp.]